MTPTDVAVQARVHLEHLRRLMAPAGIVQFARGESPDLRSGTCLDDNARAWLAAVHVMTRSDAPAYAREIGDRAAAFVTAAQRDDGWFHNMADIDGQYLDVVGSEDSIGRTIWAAGTAARCSTVPEWREAAIGLLERALPVVDELRVTHARAYAILGMSAALAPESAWPLRAAGPALPTSLRGRLKDVFLRLASSMLVAHRANATADWPWWSDTLTWGNARLPESMLRAAIATGDKKIEKAGMAALDFLASVTQPDDMFVAIGNDGWYRRDGHRAIYDQQPLEACGMVDLWHAAYTLSGDAAYLERARTAYDWFRGNNTEGLAVANTETGGCCDGLLRGELNGNQGAESTLSYVHATLVINAAAQ
ncbi:MAG TPA: hypothetical protein VFO25_01255 [Candidatus Eremiobacteraceae bacterium]|nr:hypothetical protein [Candidatus Eremiobacteraceae bacterium]